jgi:hypothetical protein
MLEASSSNPGGRHVLSYDSSQYSSIRKDEIHWRLKTMAGMPQLLL